MVDIFLEYGYYIVGIGVALFSVVVSYFSIKRYFHDMKTEQQAAIDTKITSATERVIKAINDSDNLVNQKMNTIDKVLDDTTGDIEDIKEDVKVLEEDFKNVCEKIGKHDYIVDKILPEYIDLRDSIHNFKSKIDKNILTNKEDITRNTEKDIGEEGER